MMERLTLVLPAVFGFSAFIYLWLAVRVSRASAQSANNAISFFLFLIGAMVAGAASAFCATAGVFPVAGLENDRQKT